MDIRMERISEETLSDATMIWNKVVEDGRAFPETDTLSVEEAREFFANQTYTGVAIDENSHNVVGVYILHPNNVGRCGHIANASYAVKSALRGQHIGAHLVRDCMSKAKEYGYRVLQFNAVVASNTPALRLYASLGFIPLGVIKGGFKNIDGIYEDIIPHYIEL